MFFLMKKDQAGKYDMLDFSEDKEKLIRFLGHWLNGNKKRFTFKPVKILENKKYRHVIQTSNGEEYFILDFNTVDFSAYL